MLIDKAVHAAVGNATKNAAKEEVMQWVSWDVSKLLGKSAQIQIVDQHSGGWGHIVVDHEREQMIRFSRSL